MTALDKHRSELYLRFSRHSLLTLLVMILVLGVAGLMMVLSPDGLLSHALARAPWFFPLATIFAVAVLHTSMRGNRWDPDSPEAKAILNDEWRRTNLERATKAAFITLLAAQLPMGWLLGAQISGVTLLRAVLAMAVSTILLGMSVFLVTFLISDRDQAGE